MTNQNTDNASIDWEEVILCLQFYTRSLVKGKGWFKQGSIVKRDAKNDGELKIETTYLKGQEIDDYVFGAIEKYLRNPQKHNPSKRSLIEYLKKHLIRSLVSNDLVSAENQTSRDIFAYEKENEDEDDSTPYLDSILPHAEVFFDQEIDYKEVMSYIESEVKSDSIVENIFLGLTGYGLKRREIIKEFNMTENDFDNGMRRLVTIRNNAAKKYDIKKQSL